MAIISFLREPNVIFPEEIVHGVKQRVVMGGDDQLASARLPEEVLDDKLNQFRMQGGFQLVDGQYAL